MFRPLIKKKCYKCPKCNYFIAREDDSVCHRCGEVFRDRPSRWFDPTKEINDQFNAHAGLDILW